ncbi:MAG: sigma-70 family RNA polymerase sigma factor [Candidatus Tyrphobacter sp.]
MTTVLTRDDAVGQYAHLCSRAARRFARPGLDRADLEQVAAIGLIKAADRYDSHSPTPFEAYAWLLMIGELMHYVRDCERLVRAPRRLRDLDRRWLAAEHDVWMASGREATHAEIVARTGADAAACRELRQYRAAGHIVPFDALSAPDQRALAYTIEDELERIGLESIVSGFSPLERTIIREIYECDTPIAALADKLGYSRRHVARLHRRTLRKLASAMRPSATCTGHC